MPTNHTDVRVTTNADVARTQLENALQHLRHALRCATPLIGVVEGNRLAAHIATAAGQTAEAARSVAACIDVVDGCTHIDDTAAAVAARVDPVGAAIRAARKERTR